MSSIEHIHQETLIMPLKEHGTMISKQFLASFFLPVHPGHKHLNQPKPARNLKKTVLKFEGEVNEKFRAGNNYKETIKAIHTEEVRQTIANYQVNRVLQRRPPEINPEEAELNRKSRTRLARLRSGFCRTLKSYMSRIDNSETDNCPRCQATPHDVGHIFLIVLIIQPT